MASSLVAKDTAAPRRSPVESAWTPASLVFGFLWLADDYREERVSQSETDAAVTIA
jgi:hypothetical protein